MSRSGPRRVVCPRALPGRTLARTRPRRSPGETSGSSRWRVSESGVTEIAHQAPARCLRGRWLTLRDGGSIKESILARPTFFEHFDGVVVDWGACTSAKTRGACRRIGVDRPPGTAGGRRHESGIDLYPALRLINNVQDDYARSIAIVSDVLKKMEIVGCMYLILTLHRYPENNFTDEQTRASFETSLRENCRTAARRNVVVILRQAYRKPPWSLCKWQSSATAWCIEPEDCRQHGPARSRSGAERCRRGAKGKLGLWLAACAPGRRCRRVMEHPRSAAPLCAGECGPPRLADGSRRPRRQRRGALGSG